MANSSVRYDRGQRPFLIVTLPTGEVSDEEFRAHLAEMDEFANQAEGSAFGFVIDTRAAPDPNAARRRAIAEYWDNCQRRHGSSFLGAAIAMSSSTGRAVFKAILWLRARPLVLLPVATPEEGLKQLRAIARTSARTATP